MSGHHPFSNLTRGFSPERRRRVESIKADLTAQMERQADMRVSAPPSFAEAASGELKIAAQFPEDD